MKKFLDLILFILLSLCTYAQELSVKSFNELLTDASAITNQRNDNNGNACALVKVRIASENVSFKGMVMGDVKYDRGEYYVYMPEGVKKLTVSAPNYLPLDVNFAECNSSITSLVGKVTYLLTITKGSGVTTTSPISQTHTISSGWIVLDSNPTDADVYINDDYIGKTPLSNCKKLYGHYKYRIEKNNYHSIEGEFDLNTGKYQNTIQLKPAFGSINIKSLQSNFKIYLDGNLLSQSSSCTLNEIPSGLHTLSIQKDKYAPFKQTVEVKDGLVSYVNANLQGRFASITISSISGAQIYVNGTLKGTSSYNEDMMEGVYDIEVKKEHYISKSSQIEVRAGQPQTVKLEPMPILCSLDVVSTPPNALVLIDGKDYGTTPCSVNNLLEGSHKIKISMSGYDTVQKNVILKSNTENSISFKLIADTRNMSIEQKVEYYRKNAEADHEYVDLGLSVKWATCNVGATKPEEYGDYFAWGEIESKELFDWYNYKWGYWDYLDGSKYPIIKKYRIVNSIEKLVDKSHLDPEDDAAHANWGGYWHTPTHAEWSELSSKCSWNWVTLNGVNGYKVSSSNGNYIFLPAAGYRLMRDIKDIGQTGRYWSNTLYQAGTSSAYYLYFDQNEYDVNTYNYRDCGRSIRPVRN